MFKTLCMAALSLSFPAAAQAAITFDLRDTSQTVEIESGLLTIAGLTAMLVPSAGSLNQTSGGFGVNGPGSDDTDALDAGEGITISFDQAVTVSQLSLSRLSTGESATLTLGSFPSLPLSDTGMGTDLFEFTTNNQLDVGQTLTLAHAGGNGFSFDSFTVASTTAVPEPSSLLLFGLGTLGVAGRRRWKQRKKCTEVHSLAT